MARRYFGTDGIRGKVGEGPITPEFVLRLGYAAGKVLAGADRWAKTGTRPTVLIGKDTRVSGYMLEAALEAGFSAAGVDVMLAGPMPTPGIAYLTRALRLAAGVVISASHNPYYDNGIKFFSADGNKLPDEVELQIEEQLDLPLACAASEQLGKARRLDDAAGRYIEFCKSTFPAAFDLRGMKLVVDCAHGAAYDVAPHVFHELGADVIPIGVAPNGFNINDGVGATAPDALVRAVRANHADLGIALDGDADRVVIVDENGAIVDGDQIMALIAESWHQSGRLAGGGVVSTVMSNLGLERFLGGMKLQLHRTKVGDRYVVEHMRAHGLNVGGEQSGHIVLSDFSTTGDGLVSALQVLACIKRQNRPVSELSKKFEPVPQLLKNVRVAGGKPLEEAPVKAAIEEARNRLGKAGRLVIRPSGTEPLIRVMAEGDDPQLVEAVVNDIVGIISEARSAA